jgi:hypothetical protein
MVRIITDNAPDDTAKKRAPRTPEQIAADEAQKEARAAAAARRLDTRRKIILGAALMRLVAAHPKGPDLMHILKTDYMTERDRALFDDA